MIGRCWKFLYRCLDKVRKKKKQMNCVAERHCAAVFEKVEIREEKHGHTIFEKLLPKVI